MLVTVVNPFEYLGRTMPRGSRIDVTPIQATILRRAGVITLSDGLPKSVEPFEPDPQPEEPPSPPEPPPPPPDDEDEDEVVTPKRRQYRRRDVEGTGDAAPATPEQRRSRTYRRRDLTAESPSGE